MPMDTLWGNYCNGFTYEIIYLSGPFENDPHPSGDASLIGPDLDDYFTLNDPNNGNEVVVDSRVPDLTWLGTHTFKIRGTNGRVSHKLFETTESIEFEITWEDPCLTTSVLDRTIVDMLTTVKIFSNVTQVYLDN